MVKRSIVNVLGCLIAITLISGCSTVPQRIELSASPVDKPKLVLPEADELYLRRVEWSVINASNFKEKLLGLGADGHSPVFFAITDDGYENLSLNLSDIRAYVHQQQSIINAYKRYYEASDKAIDDANAVIVDANRQVNSPPAE